MGRDPAGGGAAAARFWARRELASRWRALVVLGLLAAVAGGVALAAVAGARRTQTAYERWRQATEAPDAIVFGTQVGLNNVDYTPVKKLPEVVDSGEFVLAPIGLKAPGEIGGLQPGDTRLYRKLSRPLLKSGRLPNPRRADEIVLNRKAAQQLHLRVGDKITVISANTLDAFWGTAPFTGGPSVPSTVVGIGDSAMDQLFTPDEPGFFVSGGFLAKYGDVVPHAPNLVVRLRPGTNVDAFHRRAAAALGLPDIPVRSLADDSKRVTHATDLERTALLLFAVAAALAGLVLVGQALSRLVYLMADTVPALRALGLTRAEVVLGLLWPVLLTAAVGGVATIGVAVALSPRFPVGLAGRLEPDRGFHFDPLVLVAGAAVVFTLVLLIAAVAAHRATSVRTPLPERESALMRRFRRVAPPPMAIGAGLALERGRGERSLPVRPALAAAVIAVIGIVASLDLVGGIDDALAHPSRSGQIWDAIVSADESHTSSSLVDEARRDRDVSTIATITRVPLDVSGEGVPVYSFNAVRGPFGFEVLGGRAPVSADEAVIGPATASAMHKGIGDSITITPEDRAPDHTPRTMRIVGSGLLPQTPHSSFDQGVWVEPTTLATLTSGTEDTQSERGVAVTFRAGVSHQAAVGRLAKLTQGAATDSVSQPQDVLFLRNVRTLPVVLAGFLMLLGLAALGHVLVTAVNRRRHDLAILRTLGFRPRQAAACIAWQATTVGTIGLVIGLPLGIAIGRLAWRWIADRTPLVFVGPVALVAVLVCIPAAVILTNAIAALPARRAARLQPARILSTE